MNPWIVDIYTTDSSIMAISCSQFVFENILSWTKDACQSADTFDFLLLKYSMKGLSIKQKISAVEIAEPLQKQSERNSTVTGTFWLKKRRKQTIEYGIHDTV